MGDLRIEEVANIFPDELEKLMTSECCAEVYSVPQSHPEYGKTVQLFSKEQMLELQSRLETAEEIVKAVAHIGIDFGFGKFELNDEHIKTARKIYESGLTNQEKGDGYK